MSCSLKQENFKVASKILCFEFLIWLKPNSCCIVCKIKIVKHLTISISVEIIQDDLQLTGLSTLHQF